MAAPTSSVGARARLVFFLLAGLLFFGLPAALSLAADWQWFAEVGYLPVLTLSITAEALIGALVFGLAGTWLVLNLRQAWQTLSEEPLAFTTREGFTVALPTRAQLRPLAVLAALVGAFLVASYAANQWLTILTWWRQVPFGAADPILGHDAAFYVYTLPFLELLRNLGFALVLLAALGSAVLYAMAGQLAMTPFGPRLGARVWPHLCWLVAGLFLVLALAAWLSRAQYMVLPSGIIQGASYADVEARMPAALVLALAALAGAGLAATAAATGRTRLLVGAALLYGAVLLGGQAYAGLLQRFVVAPNEQAREARYIEHNIAATRRAFALDQVEERELSGDAELTRDDIARNRPTLDNVRLWDHQQLLETFGQIQEIRTYYDFIAVDNDRYEIGGQTRQVMLSARELNPTALPNRTWINERLVFTHGHGLTLGPVNQVTSEGLPVLFVQDLPPVTTVDINVREPSIYFGELSNEYVIARTRAREFHYPKGDDNVFVDYAGSGGVVLDSLLKKLLFAVYFRSYQILLSDDITSESRLIFDRQIRRRVSKIAPFLVYDDDPYLVVSEGRLFWIQDAYTVTDRYPYASEAARGINYIRNAVKVVIDAYNGTTTFYLAQPDDPIVRTLQAVFPALFRPLDEMPPGLRRHVRYPEGIFSLQTAVYSTYHMTSPAIFYNKEDQWEVPAIDRGGESVRMEPYYTMMKLPGEQEAEFIQMLPFTPRRRDNLASWMVARSDGEHYGQIVVFQFPKQKLIFGPRQVVARINQDQIISPQITLWSQQGSEVIQGTLMVIPIEESLIYVRPLYLRAQAGRIPELTRVIVAYQNRIVMDRTLDAAITQLFGGGEGARAAAAAAPAPGSEAAAGTPGPVTPAAPSLTQLSDEARRTYDAALAAQRAGDWATYGEEIRRLGEILGRMKQP
ncbi:MAG: UPF0182 family protein [Acidobacteria bacterium]|nr:UPF0182 family protein [Acidobacteriota bacterium]